MNDHIEEYLKYYIGLKEAPNYAILIDGDWGSGKTWLINRFIENEKNHKFIRVSLYGVTSIADIENSFFIALHPILGSKPARVASKLLKGILKTAIKFDLGLDGKENITIDYKIPDSAKWLIDLDKHIIVIDDLERSTLPINIVLGYLNELVESSGQKVIIIANEKEIEPLITKDKESQEKSDVEEKKVTKNNYSLIKEKLIGKSFTVKSDFENAFENFTFGLTSEVAKRILRNNGLYISKIFTDSTYNNLRILKQTIIDFDRFYTFMPNISEDKKELIEHIILLFFTLSFEIRKGAFNLEDINFDFPSMFESKNSLSKYRNFGNYFDHPISSDLLLQYFKYGTLSKKKLEMEIIRSSYFYDENTAAWQQLQNYYSLSDEKFDTLLKTVLLRLKSKIVQDTDELYGCIPLLIVLHYKGLVNISKQYIFNISKSNLNNLIKNGSFAASLEEGYTKSVNHTMHYRVEEFPEIGDFYTFIQNEMVKFKNKKQSKIGNEIIDNMESLDFLEKKATTDNYGNVSVNTDLNFNYINVHKFYTKFRSIPNSKKLKLAAILKYRYKYKMYRDKLQQEQEWLKKLQNLFSKTKRSESVSGLIYRDLVIFIGEILNDFEKDANVIDNNKA